MSKPCMCEQNGRHNCPEHWNAAQAAPLHLTDDERKTHLRARQIAEHEPVSDLVKAWAKRYLESMQKLSDARAALVRVEQTRDQMAKAGSTWAANLLTTALANPAPVAVPAACACAEPHVVVPSQPNQGPPYCARCGTRFGAPDPVQAARQVAYADAKRIARSHLHGPAANGCSRACGGCRVARDIANAIEAAAVRVTEVGRAEMAKGKPTPIGQCTCPSCQFKEYGG